MQITRQADYAVRAMLYLAQNHEASRIATAEIAEKQKIPITFLAKIIAQLGAAGLVRSTRGARGGVALGRAPEAITLLETVEAIDGPMLLNACVGDPDSCPVGQNCPVHEVWCQAQADLVTRLAQTTFADLSRERRVVQPLPLVA